jgi:mannose-1-phosphate guanylyltransferase
MSRFWPAARHDRPKPLFSLNGRTSLLDDTIARLPPLIPPERIFVLVPAELEKVFAAAIAGKIPRANLLLEPDRRGTAVAIAYGAALIKSRLGEGLLAVMPADHYIHPALAFRRTVAAGLRLADRNGAIVIIGVPPGRPDSHTATWRPAIRYQAASRSSGSWRSPRWRRPARWFARASSCGTPGCS